MKAIINVLTTVCLLIFGASTTFAIEKTIHATNAKTLGMGGARIAGGFGYNGFVDNPALLARVKPFRLSLINLPITTNKNFWGITGFLADNSDKFSDYDGLTEDDKFKFLKDLEEYDSAWSRLQLNPMVDIAGSFLKPMELSGVTDASSKTYDDDRETIRNAIDDNEVIFTVFKNESISFGKDKDNPGTYFVSRADSDSREEFDNFNDAYNYWIKRYRKQYDKGFSLGLAVYNNSTIALKVDRGVYEPRVWGEGSSNIAAVVGVAVPLPMYVPGLTVGVNLKYLQRRTANVFQIKATELGEDAMKTIEPVFDEVEENKSSAIAFDIGMLYDVELIGSEVAATFQSIGDGRGSSLDIGIAKHFFNDNLSIFADCIDIFDNNKENFFKKFHLGTQYRLDFLYLRAGLNSGYPTLGTGLNFGILDIDFAYFTEELSNAPGVDDDTRYALQLKLGY